MADVVLKQQTTAKLFFSNWSSSTFVNNDLVKSTQCSAYVAASSMASCTEYITGTCEKIVVKSVVLSFAFCNNIGLALELLENNVAATIARTIAAVLTDSSAQIFITDCLPISANTIFDSLIPIGIKIGDSELALR